MFNNQLKIFVHKTAVVDEGATIGNGTKVWHFSHVCAGVIIGKNCVIGQNCYIGPNVVIGDSVHIQNNVSVYELVTIEDEVFVGPSAVFTNDPYPPSPKSSWRATLLKKRCAIGANATIICGVTIGISSFVGAGAVVTHDVPNGETWVGVPARRLENGGKL